MYLVKHMLKHISFLFFVLMVISQCEHYTKSTDSDDLKPTQLVITEAQRKLIIESNAFGLELFQQVRSNENVMISPLSASAALTMALNGANGNTATQMKQLLGYGSRSLSEINEAYKLIVNQLLSADSKVSLALANAAFYEQTFSIKSSFLSALSNDFSAEVNGMDFSKSATLDAINKWASDNTNGKIPKVLDDLSPDLVLILMNALYFKGEWSKQFTESATANQTFYQSESVQFPTKFMNSDIAVTTAEVNGLQVIEIPYGRKNFSMLLVVPILSLQQQYEKLTPETWLGLTSILNEQTWDSATVLLPKFTFSYETYFNQALQSMGMLDAFDSYYANFDGISDAEKLFISFVKQNTFIEVNEEGTEAAAVTTIGFSRTSVDDPPRKPIYTFNKPFVFAIRERSSNTLLFIGSLSDPRE